MLRPRDQTWVEDFHESTKYHPGLMSAVGQQILDYEEWRLSQPTPMLPRKTFPGAPVVPLPPPSYRWARLGQVLRARRSIRPDARAPTLDAIGSVLAAAQFQAGDGKRPAPSGGGLYPLELYILATDVGDLDPGAYHYDVVSHALERLGPQRPQPDWFAEPGAFAQAPCLLVITGVLARSLAKYGARGYRFVLLEAGHVMQNVLLAAQARRLAAVPVGGFLDDKIHDGLGLDGVEEVALYTAAMGAAP